MCAGTEGSRRSHSVSVSSQRARGYVSVYVYVYVCLSVYVYVYLYAYVYDLFSNTLVERELMPRVAMSLKTRTNDSARDCSPNRIVYACICVYVLVSVSSYVYVYMFVSVSVSVYACVYVYVYVYVYMHGRKTTYKRACDCTGNRSVTCHKTSVR